MVKQSKYGSGIYAEHLDKNCFPLSLQTLHLNLLIVLFIIVHAHVHALHSDFLLQ